ncbi:hypothetical protein GCM10017687_45960 [Streptomyces echinatus]
MLAAALDQARAQVTSAAVEAEADNPSAELLARWLEARLNVPVERVHSAGPFVTAVRLGTANGEVVVDRPEGPLATLTLPGQPPRTLALKVRPTSELIAEELRRLTTPTRCTPSPSRARPPRRTPEMAQFPKLTDRPEWAALADHRDRGRPHLRELFAKDPGRAERYVVRVGDLHIDYSKQLVTDETLALLRQLAAATGVSALRDAMFRGERINVTEKRAVLHTALRAPRDAVVEVDGENVVPRCTRCWTRWPAFAERVRSGEWTGHTGKRIRNVVNVGIGGSDLGPTRWPTRPCAPSPHET